jgi:hypothetical protein
VFAATLLLIAGVLNIIYGIGALDDANVFVNERGTSSPTSTRWGSS